MLCEYHYNADQSFDAAFQAKSLRKRAKVERDPDLRDWMFDLASKYDSKVRACSLIEATLTPGPEPCAMCKLDREDAAKAS